MNRFTESLYPSYGQSFGIDRVLFEQKTGHQHLLIFENALFGRVMALDGVIQTTERDEFIYHEMLAHVPILAHGAVHRVLIIGGGDGGILREVTRHRSIEHVTQVEIDARVVEMCKQYFPGHSQGAFADPRLNLVIDDGMNFVANCADRFDLVISDSTDPIGPGEVLFTRDFYAAAHRCLEPGGVLVTQNGVAWMQTDEVRNTARRLAPVFRDWHFYHAAVPTYVGGAMAFGWASDDTRLRETPVEILRQRFGATGIRTRYYTAEIHAGAFALPAYILEAIGKTA